MVGEFLPIGTPRYILKSTLYFFLMLIILGLMIGALVYAKNLTKILNEMMAKGGADKSKTAVIVRVRSLTIWLFVGASLGLFTTVMGRVAGWGMPCDKPRKDASLKYGLNVFLVHNAEFIGCMALIQAVMDARKSSSASGGKVHDTQKDTEMSSNKVNGVSTLVSSAATSNAVSSNGSSVESSGVSAWDAHSSVADEPEEEDGGES